ncbi:hypothetical protein Aduo_006777 [Ancylostoma duodenale]
MDNANDANDNGDDRNDTADNTGDDATVNDGAASDNGDDRNDTGDDTNDNSGDDDTEIQKAIEWNLREEKKVYFELPCNADKDTAKYTRFREEPQMRCVTKGTGTANILVIGNSIAYRAFTLIHDILKGRYRTLRLYTRSSCPPISNWCKRFSAAVRKVVQHEKPDILMHIHHSLHPPIVAPIENLETDVMFKNFQQNVDFYSKYAKHIVIDMPYYKYPVLSTGGLLVERLKKGLPPGDELVVTWEQYINQTQYHRKRISSLKCDKCIINDVTKAMFQNGVHYTYDPKTFYARLADGSHMTPVGVEMLRPLYTEILEKLLAKL